MENADIEIKDNLEVREIFLAEESETTTDTAIQAVIANEEQIIKELQDIKDVAKCINSLTLVIALLVLIRWGYRKWIS